MKMYPLDTSPGGLEGRRLAFSAPENYVLKPQREGGGHNVYKAAIPEFLKSIPDDEYKSYTLMELIPTTFHRNAIIREGRVTEGEVISELGVYGSILWDLSGHVELNEEAGWLLRSKLKGVDEGGVVAGFGCLDSVCLV
jgi:glutathione synthase